MLFDRLAKPFKLGVGCRTIKKNASTYLLKPGSTIVIYPEEPLQILSTQL